jgi:proteasome lid subunit RPN8/RPN11
VPAEATSRNGRLLGFVNLKGVIVPGIHIRPNHWEEMLAHLDACLPEEGCGLLGGLRRRSSMVIPVRNALQSPLGFQMDPAELVRAMFQLEQEGVDLLAIYHSHPDGVAYPSNIDIAGNLYPKVIHIIFAHEAGGWTGRGFLIEGDEVEVGIHIE